MSDGGGAAGRLRTKNAAMASYMKAHPGNFPDSYMRPWNGEGAGIRAMARTMGNAYPQTSKWNVGMLGGVIAARLGLGASNIPAELISDRRAA